MTNKNYTTKASREKELTRGLAIGVGLTAGGILAHFVSPLPIIISGLLYIAITAWKFMRDEAVRDE